MPIIGVQRIDSFDDCTACLNQDESDRNMRNIINASMQIIALFLIYFTILLPGDRIGFFSSDSMTDSFSSDSILNSFMDSTSSSLATISSSVLSLTVAIGSFLELRCNVC